MAYSKREPRHAEILEYWTGHTAQKPLGPVAYNGAFVQKWFQGGTAVDAEIRERFSKDLDDMRTGKLEHWRNEPESAIAGVVLMDQFTRNMFRNQPQAFEMDPKALSWAKHILENNMLEGLPQMLRLLVLLPFMHAESLPEQEQCVQLHQDFIADLEKYPSAEEAKPLLGFVCTAAKYAEDHRDVIAKWGRFPHRNTALGRASTAEEALGLQEGSIPRF
eukprot:CAMPEP_0202358236 /NCGR_PEP_ID=MMETSP1126-20121109/11971_1 /ASSEMBLY_ACC=CAM_ASM_000457 /TAXON_ID=3047 /ORGANISM="Dunaliella tertiolecta, Strain CCMP1320" /LENGTH=218 /DNA_ID=CAMNT_0048951331 /DNA_START=104 /DNA_END=760 /DNA_ORIENTATION=-